MNALLKQLLLSAALACSLVTPGFAQQFPTKTVKIVVPYPPGGFNDTLARISSDKLGKIWNQSVVVENKPGGNTTIGNTYVAKSPADGYTILISPLPFSALPGLYGSKLPYDALKDFQALIWAGSAQNALVTRKGLNIKSAKELVEYARANPGKLNYGSTGSGSSNHLSMELLMNMTGVKLTHVPYKGSAPAVAALMAGEIDVLFDNVPNVIQQIRAGTVLAIGVSGVKRTALLPDTPTVAESGVPGFEVNVWFGMQVPAGTPAPIIKQVNGELVKIFREPDVTKRFNDQGVEVVASTPEEFSKLLQSEVAKWSKLIKDANIRIE
jgi:tripartite-type tricarboxylate transporter receptor subunit TctC